MQKKFITVAPDTGSGNSICNVVCDTSNPLDNSVTLNITKNGAGGFSKTVTCNREVAVEGVQVTNTGHIGSRGVIWQPFSTAINAPMPKGTQLLMDGVVDPEEDHNVFSAQSSFTFNMPIDSFGLAEGAIAYSNTTKNKLETVIRDRQDGIYKLPLYMNGLTTEPWFTVVVTLRSGT